MALTFDDLIDAESEAEEEIRRILIAIEGKTGLRLNYVRVICPTLEVDVSLKPRECAHRWSDPSVNAPPVHCLECGSPKVIHT